MGNRSSLAQGQQLAFSVKEKLEKFLQEWVKPRHSCKAVKGASKPG